MLIKSNNTYSFIKSLVMVFVIITHFSILVIAQKNYKEDKRKSENYRIIDQAILSGINIIVGSPTETSIKASIITEKNAVFFIEYYNHKDKVILKTQLSSAQREEPKEIKIENLIPNSSYSYCINYKFEDQKKFSKTAESYFSTKKSNHTSFAFGVQGDSHPERRGKMFNSQLYQKTIDTVASLKPDFYFMLGDDFSLDKLIEHNELNKNAVENVYKTQRSYWGESASNPPLFLVNGNHEQAAKYLLDGTSNNAAILAANARIKYFPLPTPDKFYTGDKDSVPFIGLLRDYYSFEWGDALFIVIDPYWHSAIPVDNQPGDRSGERQGARQDDNPNKNSGNNGLKSKKDFWSITIGDEQYQWLKKTLETSTAKYKFVFAHHVMGTGRGGIERAKYFEWGGDSQNGRYEFKNYRPNWELPLHQLFVKNKVDIFFQGHDHIFAKQELDGVIYQTVPNPADDTHTAFNQEAYTSGVILPNSGFLYINVSNEEVKVTYKRIFLKTGETNTDVQDYTYSIKK
jgi:hypothetical protein